MPYGAYWPKQGEPPMSEPKPTYKANSTRTQDGLIPARTLTILHYAAMIRAVLKDAPMNIFGAPVDMNNPDEVLVAAVFHPHLQWGSFSLEQHKEQP